MKYCGRLNTILRSLLLLAVVFVPFGRVLAAESPVFTVANYPVQAQAKDAVTAKRLAIEDGQTAAFKSLLKRIVPVTAYAGLDRVKAVQPSKYISGMSVRSEQNSSTQYYASLDFSFSANAVRDLLQREGVPFVDEQAPSLTLVPVIIPSQGGAPAQGANNWASVWSGLDIVNTVSPLRVTGWKGGLPANTLQQLKNDGAGEAMRHLASAYGGERVVVAEAEVDKAAARLHVTLSGRDAAGPIAWKHSYRISDGDVAYAMEYAAVVSLGVLEGRWKAIKARDMGGLDVMASPASQIHIQVLFNSAAEWYRLQQDISGRPGVQDFQVGSVSARGAEVALRFPGGGQQLANVLARDGISLTNNGGQWVMRKSY